MPEGAIAAERVRLVRLCTRLTGDREAAEDLAQETLLEAWRNEHMLRDPQARDRWLNGIARNLCLRWGRTRGRERARLAQPGGGADTDATSTPEGLADDFDLEVELERDELALLLDKALALLPAATRDVLVARYVGDSPYAEIAARLGLSEKAVSMRLTRGKLLLRRALTAELRHEAAPYGLSDPAATMGWQETRIWCPNCGQRRLIGRFDRAAPELILRCADCSARTGLAAVSHADWAEALSGVRGFKAAFSRLGRMASACYRQALTDGAPQPCTRCGRPARLRMGMPANLPPAIRALPGARMACLSCGYTTNQSLRGLALALPAARAFWRDHPRLRILPERAVADVGGHAAIVTSLQSVNGAARLDVISARDDFRVLAVHSVSE